jgi:hypothetical protein
MSKVAPRLLKHFYKRPEPICVGNVSSLDSNLTANLTHVSLNPPVQKSFPGVRSQGSTRATLLSDTPIRGTDTLRTRERSGLATRSLYGNCMFLISA